MLSLEAIGMLRVQEHGAFKSRFSRPILKSVDLALW